MAITQTAVTSFKVGLLNGGFNFGTGTTQIYKIALYTSAANLNAETTSYTSLSEASGSGYVAGGNVLTISQVPTFSGTTAYINFGNVSWPAATFTTRGALIYLANGTTNPAVAVLNFGADKTVSNDTFQIIFPPDEASSAIVRIS